MSSPISWSILAFCTIGSLVFGIYTWIKNKSKRRLSIEKTGYRIVDKGKNSIKKLRLLFDGKEIKDLTITKFVIWNSGNDVIRKDDIASERPLRIIRTGRAEILDAEIIAETELSNKFKLKSISSDTIVIDFEYVDKKEGIITQVVHTGNKTDIDVDCKIKGGDLISYPKKMTKKRSIIENAIYNIMHSKISIAIWILYVLLSTIIIVLALLSIFGILKMSSQSPNTTPLWEKVFTAVFLLATQVFVIVATTKMIRRQLRSNLPVELRKNI